MNSLQIFLLFLLAASASGVALTRNPLHQTIAITYYGILLGLVFFAFEAPDVALSQIVIGAVVLPLMALLTLGRIEAESTRKEREKQNQKRAA